MGGTLKLIRGQWEAADLLLRFLQLSCGVASSEDMKPYLIPDPTWQHSNLNGALGVVLHLLSYRDRGRFRFAREVARLFSFIFLQLVAKATLNKNVQIIPLPTSSSDLPGGTPCNLAGWGRIDDHRNTEKLFETNVTIYSRKKCMKFYPELEDSMICAGSYNQLRDTSQGDSGGPMVCNGVVHGIVSYGNHFPPGVYARIGHFLPWIKKTMGS
ncbi:cathepsin G [Zootoca vivipara]|uniref:cathepsin G n=1 Tax=Zootoca vivipara TaxID=8524 RepID=UPI00293C0EA4|nr:cathepsin G [Zootoca vivipara]